MFNCRAVFRPKVVLQDSIPQPVAHYLFYTDPQILDSFIHSTKSEKGYFVFYN
jgi:hypothetical protein